MNEFDKGSSFQYIIQMRHFHLFRTRILIINNHKTKAYVLFVKTLRHKLHENKTIYSYFEDFFVKRKENEQIQ